MKILKSIDSFFTKTATVLDQVAKEIDKSTEVMLKRDDIRHRKVLAEHKKLKAQLVIDGGYESEEAMEIAIKKRRDYLRGN